MTFQRLLRALAFAHSSTRMTLGVALAVSPGAVGRSWLGGGVGSGGGRVALEAMAVRDFLIGLATFHSLRKGLPVRRWFAFGVLVEAAELIATVGRADELDGTDPELWNALGVLGVVGGAVLALGLDDRAQEELARR